ncbi:phage tail sheath protein [Pseudoflavonifractor sp. 524-17]|uniref:phage tail sheath subtilisin-like domain-containing protein n=1 Tax=Pseudoflavonifractor sp. 524-17 TaxID=2304577 RepID=UPI00137B421D|nr:phage tail sheath subtilisin-like domain-containing protein [Pseudoflavonifractor sp. 524-17]NCE64679.1 phage tail sheath protein [Pseudoflavonifractor sp. 524-17]
MNQMTSHERPGVYSSYDASSIVQGGGGAYAVGIAAQCETGEAGALYHFSRFEEAAETFGEEAALSGLVKLLFQNGAAAVYAVPVAGEDYTQAFSLLGSAEGAAILTCDSTELTVQQALRECVMEASQARRERIAVVSGGAESVQALTQRAAGLNCERVVLVGPAAGEDNGAALAAAVAGAIAGERDPAVPLGGAELKGLNGLSARYTDGEIDTLVQGGVTPVEESGGIYTVVRGVTTRTKTGGASDTTWRELSTIRIVDDVIPTVREALRVKFRRAKNNEQSRGAIRSQVVLELENKVNREIINSYDGVTAQADPQNPTVCRVEFAFSVTHGLNQIWLSAHITV